MARAKAKKSIDENLDIKDIMQFVALANRAVSYNPLYTKHYFSEDDALLYEIRNFNKPKAAKDFGRELLKTFAWNNTQLDKEKVDYIDEDKLFG